WEYGSGDPESTDAAFTVSAVVSRGWPNRTGSAGTERRRKDWGWDLRAAGPAAFAAGALGRRRDMASATGGPFMTHDFSPLTGSGHWLGWLGDDPAQVVRGEIEGILRRQVPTAQLEWVHLLAEPYYLTGGRKLPDEPGQMVVTRAALAVPFE